MELILTVYSPFLQILAKPSLRDHITPLVTFYTPQYILDYFTAISVVIETYLVLLK